MKHRHVVGLIGALTLVVGCGNNPAGHAPDSGVVPLTATITVVRAGEGRGSVTGHTIACGTTCTVTVALGTTVTLTAAPGAGATFGAWSGGTCLGSATTCEVVVQTDVTITARFDVAMFTVDLTLLGNGIGAVSSTPAGMACPGVCTLQVPYNTVVTLAAVAGLASSFMGWGGACTTTTGTCSFTVTADVRVMAAFAADNDLIVMPAGTGTGTVTSTPAGISCGLDCAQGYAPGTVVTLAAAAAGDSSFAGWSGAGCTGTGACEVTMAAAEMVTATFALQQHDLSVATAGAGGGLVESVPAGIECGASCTATYDAHTVVTLTATADASSTFGGWAGGGCSGTSTCVVTIEDAVSVTATFDVQLFALDVSLAGDGSGSVSSMPAGIVCGVDCSEDYALNTVVTLVPAATAGVFAGWSGACSGHAACVVTMTRATSVTARFQLRGGLFMIADVTDHLQTIDPVTLALTDIGALGVSYSFGDCAWHVGNSQLYVTDGRATNRLFRVNLATGAATLVGTHGIADMFALGYYPPTNALYGIGGNGNLYELNAATGAASLVGATGHTNFNGLVWDSARSRLVGFTAGAAAFYSINVTTGASTLLQRVPFLDNNGMTYDPIVDQFWATDYNGTVATFDPNASFARTTLGTVASAHTCLAFVPRQD